MIGHPKRDYYVITSLKRTHFINLIMPVNVITKLPESDDLCGNVTEFGVEEGLPYRSPDEGYFVFISYCLMILCH